MRNDASRLVRALLRSGVKIHEEVLPHGCVVALSRDCACGGEDVARLLATTLRVRCFDRELLDAVVREARLERHELERLDEHVSGRMDAWVHSALFSRNALPEDYWRSMSHVIVRIADHGGVIVGRGAHLILSKGLAFRVRLTGSPEVCAHRLARQESISMEDALKRVQEVNKERAGSIEKQFGRSAYDGGAFDLTLNTDRLDPPAAVAVIVHAMKQMGMPVPEEETAAVS
jgi:hypothetical protein